MGEMRRILALGRGSAIFLVGLAAVEDMYCFSSSGLGAIFALLFHAVAKDLCTVDLLALVVLEYWWYWEAETGRRW